MDFKSFIFESKGISDITIEKCDEIWNEIELFIKDLDKEHDYISPYFNRSMKKNYNYKDTEIKIANLEVIIKIKKYKENVCNGLNDNTETYMFNNILFNPVIILNVFFNKLDNNFLKNIKSKLLHEMVHVFQRYKQGDKTISRDWQLGSMLPEMRKNIKNEEIKQLINILYLSLEHELSAQLHEYFINGKKYGKKYDKIFQIRNMINDFNIYDIEINDETIKELNYIREEYLGSVEYNKSKHINYNHTINSKWKTEITADNKNSFFKMLDNRFKKAVLFLDKKITLIDSKVLEEKYNFYISESEIFAKIMTYK